MTNAGEENWKLAGNSDVGDIQLENEINNLETEKVKELEREGNENGGRLRQSGFSFVIAIFCYVLKCLVMFLLP